MTSAKYNLNWKDAAKGLLIATLTSAIVFAQESFDAGEVSFKWKELAMAAIAGGIAYLFKNYFSGESKNTVNQK